MKKHPCKYCSGRVDTIEDFQKKVALKNDLIEVSGTYTGDLGELHAKCLVCGYEWDTTAHNIFAVPRCAKCSRERQGNKRRKSIEQMELDIAKVNPHIHLVGEYKNNKTLAKFRCDLDGCIWESYPSNILNGSAGCPSCRSSSNENKISTWFKSKGFDVCAQYRIADCRDKKPLVFDLYVPALNLFVEYDGEQHYFFIPFNKHNTHETYEAALKRDKIKDDYCEKNNLPLIRVPYWERDNIEEYLTEQMRLLGLSPLPQ